MLHVLFPLLELSLGGWLKKPTKNDGEGNGWRTARFYFGKQFLFPWLDRFGPLSTWTRYSISFDARPGQFHSIRTI